jgi:NTE family protein
MDAERQLDPTLTESRDSLQDGIALCLSGGGYRAMLFHLGALWRLNELRILRDLKRVSSVSGGSIAAGVVGAAWRDLKFVDGGAANFVEKIAAPIHRLASTTIDVWAVISGAALPRVRISDRVEAAYEKHLFGDFQLQQLPSDEEGPRFVFNATSLQTGALFRFSRPYMADYLVGRFLAPRVSLAKAVAASSAFPPVLSPVELDLSDAAWEDGSGDSAFAAFRTRALLTDGGVYDNLGLETAWKRYRTILISDGGGMMPRVVRPAVDWLFGVVRVLNVIDNQVRSLRKRIAIAAFREGVRSGAYFGIGTNIADYGLPDALAVAHERSLELAHLPTRLARIPKDVQERLVNWGYAVCDAAVRKHVRPGTPAPERLPYPGSPI